MPCRICPYPGLNLAARFSRLHFKRSEAPDLIAGADPADPSSTTKSQKLSQTFAVLRQISATLKVPEFAGLTLSSDKSQVSRQAGRKAGTNPYIGFPFRCASDPELRLPEREAKEDFIEGQLRFGPHVLGVYFEHSLGFFSLDHPDRAPLDEAWAILESVVRVA
jgi:hypothetical protein